MRKTMNQALQRARDVCRKIGAGEAGMEGRELTRGLVTLLAILGILLPWATLDGHASALSGSKLAPYALFGAERGFLFSVSWYGALALILAPIVTIIAVGHGFFLMIMGRRALRSHFVGAAAPLLMLLVAGSILSGDSPSLGWFVIPGVGMIVTAAAQGILFAEAMVEGDRNPA